LRTKIFALVMNKILMNSTYYDANGY